MKSYLKKLLVCVLSLFSLTAQSAQYSLNDIPMVHLQNSRRYVSNPDGILSTETEININALLADLEDSLMVETAVVVVESFDEDCWDIATNLINKYGIGKNSTNNGLVVTLATQDRCVAFATGDGMEGVMPDAICHRIQVNHMNPLLGEEKWDEGMLAGVQVIHDYLLSNADESIIGGTVNAADTDMTGSDWLKLLCVLFIGPLTWLIYMVFASPLSIYRYWKYRECPACKKHAYKVVSIKEKRGTEVRRCNKCGCEHEEFRKEIFIPMSVWSIEVYSFILSAIFRSGGSGGGGGRSGGGYGGGHSSGGGGRSHF